MIDKSDHIVRKMALYAMYGYFLSTTFSHALAQNLLALMLIGSIILIFIEQRQVSGFKFDFLKASIFLFIAWSVISALFGETPLSSLFVLKEEWLFLMIPAAVFIIRKESELKTALMIFAFSAFVVGLYAFWQHFGGVDLYRGEDLVEAPSTGFRVIGFFSHRLTCGNYFAVAGLLFLGIGTYCKGYREKILFYGAYFLSALTVAFTYSRGPFAVLIIGTLALLLLSGKKAIRAMALLIVVISIIITFASPDIFNRYSSSFEIELEGKYAGSRLSIFRTAGRIIVDHPLFGVGQGNFGKNFEVYRDADSDRRYGHAHNDILNVAAYAGILGALFFLMIWLAILLRGWRLYRLIRERQFSKGVAAGLLVAIFGFFLTSFYEASFADEEIRLMLMALFGLALALERIVKRNGKITEVIEKA